MLILMARYCPYVKTPCSAGTWSFQSKKRMYATGAFQMQCCKTFIIFENAFLYRLKHADAVTLDCLKPHFNYGLGQNEHEREELLFLL
jgi:hypothetical protein